MRRLTSTTLALGAVGALAGTLLAAGPSTGAAPAGPDARAASGRYVDFALTASGFGTLVTGGDLPADSSQTGYMRVGCSTRVGIDRENHEAALTLPGLGRASAVKTRIWTRKVHGVVSSYAENTIGKVVLAQSGLGSLQLRAITAFAHSFHDAKGFHAETRTAVGGLQFVPPGGRPQNFDLPVPGNPIVIPGLAKISIGASAKRVNRDGASAQANALVVTSYLTHSRVTVGQARAQVLTGAQHGTFHGFSSGTEARGLADNLTSGRTPLTLMPCQGTDGKVQTKRTASVDLGDGVDVSVLQSQQMAQVRRGRSVAWERGSIAGVNLGDGQLVVDGIVGKVKVTRHGKKVSRSFKGSKVGAITVNGQERRFPDIGVIDVPGVARIERFVRTRFNGGASIVALRVTLLDGTGAVLDLGRAKAIIRRH